MVNCELQKKYLFKIIVLGGKNGARYINSTTTGHVRQKKKKKKSSQPRSQHSVEKTPQIMFSFLFKYGFNPHPCVWTQRPVLKAH